MSEWGWEYKSADFKKAWPPWHDQTAAQFTHRYKDSALHSGLLLRGAQGLGKRQFAKKFASLLLCDRVADAVSHSNEDGLFVDQDLSSNQNIELACGECSSCLLLLAGTHPDLHFITVEDGKKAVAVDQIRELIEAMQKTPQVSQAKVAIVDPADAMNESASNALLKMLEEPPPHSYFILVSDYFDRLLPTIRSRCYSQPFAIPDRQRSIEYLAQDQGVDPNSLERLWEKHRGFVQRIIDELEGNGEEPLFEKPLLAFLQNKVPAKVILDLLDKGNLVAFAEAATEFFANHGMLKAELSSLTTQQTQLLYQRSIKLLKDTRANPLAKLFVIDFLADCKSLVVGDVVQVN